MSVDPSTTVLTQGITESEVEILIPKSSMSAVAGYQVFFHLLPNNKNPITCVEYILPTSKTLAIDGIEYYKCKIEYLTSGLKINIIVRCLNLDADIIYEYPTVYFATTVVPKKTSAQREKVLLLKERFAERTGTYVEKGLGDDETLDGILKDLFAADLEPTDYFAGLGLCFAIKNGHVSIVKKLLSYGTSTVPITHTSGEVYDPLVLAKDNEVMLELLQPKS